MPMTPDDMAMEALERHAKPGFIETQCYLAGQAAGLGEAAAMLVTFAVESWTEENYKSQLYSAELFAGVAFHYARLAMAEEPNLAPVRCPPTQGQGT